ncbi:hypothetical protein [Brevibacillus sp. SAFN-007a]|uniref:hypothetical protein n=1 Tax=Brevibacillus sp. SAFN-007a TaxID=3436862 RepID=UPI003F7FC0BE
MQRLRFSQSLVFGSQALFGTVKEKESDIRAEGNKTELSQAENRLSHIKNGDRDGDLDLFGSAA